MSDKFLQYLNSHLSEWTVEYRVHATRRMFERDINETDILFLLKTGDIIEEYLQDFPFPSVLVNGRDPKGRVLHAVVGIDSRSQRTDGLYL